MRVTGLVGLAAVAMATSGCFTFDFDPNLDGGLNGPIDAGPPIVIPADPLTATGTLDTARAAQRSFGWDAGGALTVTAADGTVFTLTVPEGSLTQTETITMTPYTTLDTGLGEASHGVKLEPEGLQTTVKLLELTITPPAGTTWPVDQQVPFTLQGARNVVSLAAVDPASATLKLKLGHFSSYGFALARKGFDATLAGVRNRLGGDAEAQLETEVATYLSKERAHQLLGAESGDSFAVTMQSFFDRYVEQVIKPRLAAAKDSCANARLAIQTVLGYERQMQLLGAAQRDDYRFDFTQFFDLSVVCFKEEYELCRDNHIVTRMIPLFIGTLRQMQLLGIGENGRYHPSRFQAEQYMAKCLQFSLEFSSSTTYTQGTGADVYTMRESATLPPNATAQYVANTEENPSGLFHVDSTGALITGTFTDFTVSGYQAQYQNPCASVSGLMSGGGQFALTSLAFRPKTGDLATRAQVDDFFVVPALIPNSSQHTLSERSRDSNGACSGTPSVSTVVDNWSHRGFSPWLSSLNGSSADSYISGWTIVGGTVMATKRVQWSDPNQGITFSADFTLRHIPDPN